jgi:hypothetical protein
MKFLAFRSSTYYTKGILTSVTDFRFLNKINKYIYSVTIKFLNWGHKHTHEKDKKYLLMPSINTVPTRFCTFRDGASRIHPLHRNQHAYQRGQSTETALHNMVKHRICYWTQEHCSGSIPWDRGSLWQNLFWHNKTGCWKAWHWAHNMQMDLCYAGQQKRKRILSEEILGKSVARGSPQGGVQSSVIK